MIRILHHHLRRGGVTRVICASAGILRDAGEEVEIWSGEASTDPLPEGVGFRYLTDLAYRPDFSEQACHALTQILMAAHREGDLWHIHNFSLGKNPVFTAAVCKLAAAGLPLVLQIHDFAEDGRPANLNLLRTTLPKGCSKLYPFGPHIVYAVLQARDRAVLQTAGIPADRIVLLPNPISSDLNIPPPNPAPQRLLYLTRAIRRKNVGEFVYWAKALAHHFEFCTSLIPENPAEKIHFDRWAAFCESENIPIKWGVGLSGKSFETVLTESDACISTSVGEGFGMSFLEPYAVGRSVLGRDLPLITHGFKQDGVQLDHLYAALPVPIDALDLDFWPRALQAVNQWRRRMGLPADLDPNTLQNAWVREGQIDFGRLDESAQRHILKTISMSHLHPEDLLRNSGPETPDNRRVIAEQYSPGATLKRLQDVYARLSSGNQCAYADAHKIRDAFTDLSALSLLRI